MYVTGRCLVFYWTAVPAGFCLGEIMNREKEEKTPQGNSGQPVYLDRVRELVEETQYGTVTIIVQDGKVIQVDRTEKFRL